MGKRKSEYQLIILSGEGTEMSTGFFYPSRIAAIEGARRHRARHPTLRQLADIRMQVAGSKGGYYLHKGIVWKETPKTLLTKKQARFPSIGDLLRS